MNMVDPFLYEGRDPLWWYNYYWQEIFDLKAQGKNFILGGCISRERYIDTVKMDGWTDMRFKVELVPVIMVMETVNLRQME